MKVGIALPAGLLVCALTAYVSRPHTTRRVIGPWKSGTVVVCDHGSAGAPRYRVEWRNTLGAAWLLLESGRERPRARVLANDTLAVAVVDPATVAGRELLLTRLWTSPFAEPREQVQRTPVAYRVQPVEPPRPTHELAVEIDVPMVGIGEGH